MEATEPKHKNLTVTHLRPELHNLFIALSEIESCSRAELLEALLFPFVKSWIDQRERSLDVDPSVMESLHHAVSEAFLNQTVIHCCRYIPHSTVPEEKRQMVRDRMLR
ncbi:hypothetical protein QFX18_15190 [Saccharophagus degradans]|uniref:hypothetical protein n=1 Tax=Saccharophagus degradans TaxID=86304 RepID=UPI002477FD17|nr:hypothetical protein [Saccharophagus degradans]WGO97380.1 hypothetical protein QFX18_15190 [Saccharophagus degradans]